MAFRGFPLVAAMVTVSELGDSHRFEHPRQLMIYLGLVPTESSSGPRQRQGAIYGLRFITVSRTHRLILLPLM
jgi:transposase